MCIDKEEFDNVDVKTEVAENRRSLWRNWTPAVTLVGKLRNSGFLVPNMINIFFGHKIILMGIIQILSIKKRRFNKKQSVKLTQNQILCKNQQ